MVVKLYSKIINKRIKNNQEIYCPKIREGNGLYYTLALKMVHGIVLLKWNTFCIINDIVSVFVVHNFKYINEY